jgi:hypothetical protein
LARTSLTELGEVFLRRGISIFVRRELGTRSATVPFDLMGVATFERALGTAYFGEYIFSGINTNIHEALIGWGISGFLTFLCMNLAPVAVW